MYSKYVLDFKKCCFVIEEMAKSDTRKMIILTTLFGTSKRRLAIRIDTVTCRYCPFCGKEFEFELTKGE